MATSRHSDERETRRLRREQVIEEIELRREIETLRRQREQYVKEKRSRLAQERLERDSAIVDRQHVETVHTDDVSASGNILESSHVSDRVSREDMNESLRKVVSKETDQTYTRVNSDSRERTLYKSDSELRDYELTNSGRDYSKPRQSYASEREPRRTDQNVKYKENLYDTIDTTGYRLATLDSENSDMDRRSKESVRQKPYISVDRYTSGMNIVRRSDGNSAQVTETPNRDRLAPDEGPNRDRLSRDSGQRPVTYNERVRETTQSKQCEQDTETELRLQTRGISEIENRLRTLTLKSQERKSQCELGDFDEVFDDTVVNPFTGSRNSELKPELHESQPTQYRCDGYPIESLDRQLDELRKGEQELYKQENAQRETIMALEAKRQSMIQQYAPANWQKYAPSKHTEYHEPPRSQVAEIRSNRLEILEEKLQRREKDICSRESFVLEQERREAARKQALDRKDMGSAIEQRLRSLEKREKTLDDRERRLIEREDTLDTKRIRAEVDTDRTPSNLRPNYPKLSVFSGEEPKPKVEVSFEEWEYEISCVSRMHTEAELGHAIRKSLKGQAKRILLPLGSSATVRDIRNKLEYVFGNVTSGETILQSFYLASQRADESVAAWGLRLEEILHIAIDKGHVDQEKKNGMLRSKFWKSLRNEKLRNATRVYYESSCDFKRLQREVRAEENEMKLMSIQHRPVKATETTEDARFDVMMKKMESLERQLQEFTRGQFKREGPTERDQNKYRKGKSRQDKSSLNS